MLLRGLSALGSAWPQLGGRASDEDIQNLFLLFLGRRADESAIAGKRGGSIAQVTERLVCSEEFLTKVLPQLESSEVLAGQATPAEITPLRSLAESWFGVQKPPTDWGALLASSLATRRLQKLLRDSKRSRAKEVAARLASLPTPRTAELAESEVRGLSLVLLGRYPNARDSIADRIKLGRVKLVRRLLTSAECESSVLDPALEGRALPHEGVSREVPDWVSGIVVSELVLSDEALARLRATKQWAPFLGALLGDPRFRSEYLSGPAGDPAFLRSLKAERAAEALLATTPTSRITRGVLNEERMLSVTLFPEPEIPGLGLRVSAPKGVCRSFEWSLSELPRPVEKGVYRVPLPDEYFSEQVRAVLVELVDANSSAARSGPFPVVLTLEPQIVEDLYRKGRKLLSTGSLAEAEESLRKAFRAAPGHFGRWLLCDAVALRGAYAEAHAVAAGGPASETEDPLGLCRLAGLLIRQDRVDEAAEVLSRRPPSLAASPLLHLVAAVAAVLADREPAGAPAGAAPWQNLVIPFAEYQRASSRVSGPDTKALRTIAAGQRVEQAWLWVQAELLLFTPPFGTAQTLKAFEREGHVTIAEVCRRGDKAELRHLLLPVLALLSPSQVPQGAVLVQVAKYLETGGNLAQAADFVTAAVAADPQDPDSTITAAYILQKARRLEGAAVQFKRAAETNPGEHRFIERLAAVERQLVNRDPLRSQETLTMALSAATESATRRVMNAPVDPGLRFSLVRALVLGERYAEAKTILEDLLAQVPDQEEYLLELVRVCEKMRDPDAVALWAGRLLEGPRDQRTLLTLAKALRGVNRAEDGHPLLEAMLSTGDPEVAREYARNLFFLGRFNEAAEEAERLLAVTPEDHHLRLYAAAAWLELGEIDRGFAQASRLALNGGHQAFPEDLSLLLYALLQKRGETALAFRQLNTLFTNLGCQKISLGNETGVPPFDRLEGTGEYQNGVKLPYPPVFDGPLVSVIMTAFNASAHIDTAVRSILGQTYRNLELIVVDDASTDDTAQKLARLAATDRRVRVIYRTTNSGTYVSKNIGLLQACGEIVALQDSDDWSHPDRLAKAVSVLSQRPDVVGLTTDWIRMTTQGEVVIKAGVQIAHVCCISLVFRRQPVVSAIGFFDSVRIEADMEFIRRMTLRFGPSAVLRLRWPLLFGRAHSASLTASEEFGLTRTGFTAPRLAYQAAQRQWHQSIARGQSPYLEFPLAARCFPAPPIMLP